MKTRQAKKNMRKEALASPGDLRRVWRAQGALMKATRYAAWARRYARGLMAVADD